MGVSIAMVVPPNHPFEIGIFPEINHEISHSMGVFIAMGDPQDLAARLHRIEDGPVKDPHATWSSLQVLVIRVESGTLGFFVPKKLAGWWLGHPSEKYELVNWDDEIPNIWENKKWQPNHQPVGVWTSKIVQPKNK